MNIWGILIGLVFIAFGVGIALNINVWQYIFPIIFILIGLSIILGHRRHRWHQPMNGSPENPSEIHDDTLDYSFSFSGGDFKVVSKDFKGGKISAFFGGANIDLRDATIAKHGVATLDVSALFGGVKLLVPKEWKVVGNLSGFFVGFSNKTSAPDKPKGTLVIKGSATFGGGEVSN